LERKQTQHFAEPLDEPEIPLLRALPAPTDVADSNCNGAATDCKPSTRPIVDNPADRVDRVNAAIISALSWVCTEAQAEFDNPSAQRKSLTAPQPSGTFQLRDLTYDLANFKIEALTEAMSRLTLGCHY
jgi:hypothetical protein